MTFRQLRPIYESFKDIYVEDGIKPLLGMCILYANKLINYRSFISNLVEKLA